MDLGAIFGGAAFQNESFLASGFCFLIIAVWVLFLLIAIWVYRDAESRGMSGVLWLIVILIAGIIGLIIYLIVRGSHPVRPPGYFPPGYPPPYGYAPPGYPSAPPPSGWGSQAPPATPPPAGAAMVTCRSCGTPSPAGTRFCPKCGAPM